MSLRLRLALVASALVLGGVALGLTLMYGVIVANSNLTLDRESAILAEVIHEAVLVRGDLGVRVPAVVETYLTDETGVSSAQVYLGGQLLWEGGVLDAPRPLDPVGIVEGKGTRTVAGWRVATLHDPTDGITVQVGRPLAGVRETLAPFASLVVPLTVALTVAAGALAWALAGVALRPLRRLTAAVSRPNGVSVPPIAGRDEPAQLARAYGDLLERLQEQRLRESRFLEYAAHELRTPLSALRASLDAAHGRGGIGPETVGRLRNEARRLEVLAQNLLALSRAEAAELHLDTVDLAALASDAYDRFLPLAMAKGIGIDTELSPAVVRADPRLLAQALDNLVHNAIRATGHGGVTIRTGTQDGSAHIEVTDTGPGFPATLKEGLGLRVVRAVAAAHEAALELDGDAGATARLAVAARALTHGRDAPPSARARRPPRCQVSESSSCARPVPCEPGAPHRSEDRCAYYRPRGSCRSWPSRRSWPPAAAGSRRRPTRPRTPSSRSTRHPSRARRPPSPSPSAF